MVVAAQCCHETGWGRFGRTLTPAHGNTGGLKIRDPGGRADDDPDAHARFAVTVDGRPRLGARAHVHHLRLYCGLPVLDDTPDPRAAWVQPGSAGFATVRHVADLGGRWASAADYGAKVADVYRRLTTPPVR